MNKTTSLILILIVFLGGFLRIFNLSNSPPSLNWDETALGYNAYSISETLRDEYGKVLPIFTRSFDDYKSAIPVYLLLPSIKIFGLNEFGVRFPSAFLGVVSIVLVFLITKSLFKDSKAALASSFVFAIEPWSVHFSRVLHEANIALFFLLLGFLFFLYSLKKSILLIPSIAFFGLSNYTYHSNKLIVPLFFLALIVIHHKRFAKYSKKIILTSLFTLTVFMVPFVILIFAGQVFARATSTNIFILWPKSGNVLEKLYYFFWELGGRYLAYFSPPNLFIREPQEPSTIVSGNSIFYPFEFIPWIIGLSYLVIHLKKNKELTALLLLSPLPAILTWNWFQPARTMSLFVLFSILIGLGIVKMFDYFSHKFELKAKLYIKSVLFFTFAVYGLVSALYLFDSINVQLPERDAGNWQPGFKETVPVVMELEKDYGQVIIETSHAQPYIFYLFYGKYSPEKYLMELDLEKIGTPRKTYDFGKFKFRKIYWPEDKSLKNTLFVGSEESLPQNDIETQKGAKAVGAIKDRWGRTGHKLVATE